MCENCNDFQQLLYRAEREYEQAEPDEGGEIEIKLSVHDVSVSLNFLQIWHQKQCMCIFRDIKNLERFSLVVQQITRLALIKLKQLPQVLTNASRRRKSEGKDGENSDCGVASGQSQPSAAATDRETAEPAAQKADESAEGESRKDNSQTEAKKSSGADESASAESSDGCQKNADSSGRQGPHDGAAEVATPGSSSEPAGDQTEDEDWWQDGVEKLVSYLSRMFMLQFPLYLAAKQAGSKLEDLSEVEATSLAVFLDVTGDVADIPLVLLRNVAKFCRSGGLLAMAKIFQLSPTILPIGFAHGLVSILCNLKLWLNPRALSQLFSPVRAAALQYLCELNDQELRQQPTRVMADFLWSSIRDNIDTPVPLDREGLELAFKYFSSTTLTMRLTGINQVNSHISLYNEMASNESQPELEMLGQELADWIISSKLVEHIFGPNLHVEVIKQSHLILNFLGTEGRINNEHIDVIWQAAQLKYCSKQVHDLLPPLIKSLDAGPLLHLFQLLKNLPPKDHTEQTIYLAQILQKFIWSSSGGGGGLFPAAAAFSQLFGGPGRIAANHHHHHHHHQVRREDDDDIYAGQGASGPDGMHLAGRSRHRRRRTRLTSHSSSGESLTDGNRRLKRGRVGGGAAAAIKLGRRAVSKASLRRSAAVMKLGGGRRMNSTPGFTHRKPMHGVRVIPPVAGRKTGRNFATRKLVDAHRPHQPPKGRAAIAAAALSRFSRHPRLGRRAETRREGAIQRQGVTTAGGITKEKEDEEEDDLYEALDEDVDIEAFEDKNLVRLKEGSEEEGRKEASADKPDNSSSNNNDSAVARSQAEGQETPESGPVSKAPADRKQKAEAAETNDVKEGDAVPESEKATAGSVPTSHESSGQHGDGDDTLCHDAQARAQTKDTMKPTDQSTADDCPRPQKTEEEEESCPDHESTTAESGAGKSQGAAAVKEDSVAQPQASTEAKTGDTVGRSEDVSVDPTGGVPPELKPSAEGGQPPDLIKSVGVKRRRDQETEEDNGAAAATGGGEDEEPRKSRKVSFLFSDMPTASGVVSESAAGLSAAASSRPSGSSNSSSSYWPPTSTSASGTSSFFSERSGGMMWGTRSATDWRSGDSGQGEVMSQLANLVGATEENVNSTSMKSRNFRGRALFDRDDSPTAKHDGGSGLPPHRHHEDDDDEEEDDLSSSQLSDKNMADFIGEEEEEELLRLDEDIEVEDEIEFDEEMEDDHEEEFDDDDDEDDDNDEEEESCEDDDFDDEENRLRHQQMSQYYHANYMAGRAQSRHRRRDGVSETPTETDAVRQLSHLRLDNVTEPGNTLLWDLVQDGNIERLSEDLHQELEKSVCSLLCFNTERFTRIKFIEGCLRNLADNRSVVISLKLLPKLLQSFHNFPGSDPQEMTMYIEKTHNMTDLFFRNLKTYTQQRQANKCDTGFYTHQTEIQVRLHFLAVIFSNCLSPDSFRLSENQVCILWECLARDPATSEDLFQWLLSQTETRDQHAIAIQSVKYIYREKLPGLSPETMTMTGLNLLSHLGTILSLAEGGGHPNNQHQDMDQLWRIALQANNTDVSLKAIHLLNSAYLGRGEEFLETCMEHLKEAGSRLSNIEAIVDKELPTTPVAADPGLSDSVPASDGPPDSKEKAMPASLHQVPKDAVSGGAVQEKTLMIRVQRALLLLKAHLETFRRKYAFYFRRLALEGRAVSSHGELVKDGGLQWRGGAVSSAAGGGNLIRIVVQPGGAVNDKTTFELASSDLLADLRAEVSFWWEERLGRVVSAGSKGGLGLETGRGDADSSAGAGSSGGGGGMLTELLGAAGGPNKPAVHIRLITQGHELSQENDDRTLGELGFKDLQLVFANLGTGSGTTYHHQQQQHHHGRPPVSLAGGLFQDAGDAHHFGQGHQSGSYFGQQHPSSRSPSSTSSSPSPSSFPLHGFSALHHSTNQLPPFPGQTKIPMLLLLESRHFDQLFSLISTLSNIRSVGDFREQLDSRAKILSRRVWEIILLLPTNPDIKQRLANIGGGTSAAKIPVDDQQQAATDDDDDEGGLLAELLDPHSPQKLLYSFYIIDWLIGSGGCGGALGNNDSAAFSAATSASTCQQEAAKASGATAGQRSQPWLSRFIAAGGLKHLFNIFHSGVLGRSCDRSNTSRAVGSPSQGRQHNLRRRQAVAWCEWKQDCLGALLRLLYKIGVEHKAAVDGAGMPQTAPAAAKEADEDKPPNSENSSSGGGLKSSPMVDTASASPSTPVKSTPEVGSSSFAASQQNSAGRGTSSKKPPRSTSKWVPSGGGLSGRKGNPKALFTSANSGSLAGDLHFHHSGHFMRSDPQHVGELSEVVMRLMISDGGDPDQVVIRFAQVFLDVALSCGFTGNGGAQAAIAAAGSSTASSSSCSTDSQLSPGISSYSGGLRRDGGIGFGSSNAGQYQSSQPQAYHPSQLLTGTGGLLGRSQVVHFALALLVSWVYTGGDEVKTALLQHGQMGIWLKKLLLDDPEPSVRREMCSGIYRLCLGTGSRNSSSQISVLGPVLTILIEFLEDAQSMKPPRREGMAQSLPSILEEPGKEPYGPACRDYFWILCRLVESLPPITAAGQSRPGSVIAGNESGGEGGGGDNLEVTPQTGGGDDCGVDTLGLALRLMHGLVTRPYYERRLGGSSGSRDDALIGMLHLLTALIQQRPMLKLQLQQQAAGSGMSGSANTTTSSSSSSMAAMSGCGGGGLSPALSQPRTAVSQSRLQDFVHQLFDFLFALPSPGQKMFPKCKSQESRAACYDLLAEIAKGCYTNYVQLHSLLLGQHELGSHKPYPWEYWPREEGRGEAGYVGLVNLGATCYMATCVQQLFMIPALRSAVLQDHDSVLASAGSAASSGGDVENLSSDGRRVAGPVAAAAGQQDGAANLTGKREETFGKHQATLQELRRMFAYLLESERKAYNPVSFCKTYTMDQMPLNTGEQKDMAEFFIDLLSKMEEMTPDLKRVVKSTFCGTLSNNVVSLDCNHVSTTTEEFYTVRCQVAEMRSLYQSLEEVCVKDMLEGDNMYTCSQCSAKVRAEKRACFKSLPDILAFNTMRYSFNMVTMLKEKVNSHFSFPFYLDMTPYMEHTLLPSKAKPKGQESSSSSAAAADQPSPEQGGSSSKTAPSGRPAATATATSQSTAAAKTTSPTSSSSCDPAAAGGQEQSYEYELIGVTVHTGNADGGHYYAFIKDRNPAKPDKWYSFNDAEVKVFDQSQIPAECFGGEMNSRTYDQVTDKFLDLSIEKTNSAYMLFYERINKRRSAAASSAASTAVGGSSSVMPGPSSCLGDLGPFSMGPDSGGVAVTAASTGGGLLQTIHGSQYGPQGISLGSHLEGWIWQDNKNFIQDNNIFDHTYFNFMWQMVAQLPNTLHQQQEVSVEEVTLLSAKLATTFFLETFIHAKEKLNIVQWVEALTKQLDSSVLACKWFLQHMATDSNWPVTILVRCSIPTIRQMFHRLVLHVIQKLRGSESSLYLLPWVPPGGHPGRPGSQMRGSGAAEGGPSVGPGARGDGSPPHLDIDDELDEDQTDMSSSSSRRMRQRTSSVSYGMGDDDEEDDDRDDDAERFPDDTTRAQIGDRSSVARFVRMLLLLLDSGAARPHIKQLTELFTFLYDFAKLGEAESELLLSIQAISTCVEFYMKSVGGNSIGGLLEPELEISDEDDEEEDDIINLPMPTSSSSELSAARTASLDKMIWLLALLVEKSRRRDNLIQLAPADMNALTSGKSLLFLYNITRDNINLRQTCNLIFSLTRHNAALAGTVAEMVFLGVKSPEHSLHFFRLLTLLTELNGGPAGLPCYTSLIMYRVWDLAKACPQAALDWLSIQVTRNRHAQTWLLNSMDEWVEQYLIAQPNSKVRSSAAFLIVSLVPSTHCRQTFRCLPRGSVPGPPNSTTPNNNIRDTLLANGGLESLHRILDVLLSLLKRCRNYIDISSHGTNRLVSYFQVLSHLTLGRIEKLMLGKYFQDLWNLFHPRLSEPTIPIHQNKQALLQFWYWCVIDCPENINLILTNSHVIRNLPFNYILADHEDGDVVTFNRSMLPAYYGLLRMCCIQSRTFARQLSHHQNIQWAFKNISPYSTQYTTAVDELLKLIQLFVAKTPRNPDEEVDPEILTNEALEIRQFRTQTLQLYLSILDGRSSWATLVAVLGILIETDEDRLLTVLNNGLTLIFDAFNILHLMHHEATACHVTQELRDLLSIYGELLRTVRNQNKTSELHAVLSRWKDMADMTSRLVTLCNTFTPSDLRETCLSCLKEMLLLWPNEMLSILVPIFQRSHIAATESECPLIGPYFPRRDSRAGRLSGLMTPGKQTAGGSLVGGGISSRPPRPMLQLTIPPGQLEAVHGQDPDYDKALHRYFWSFHHLVDLMVRVAINEDSITKSLIELSTMVGLDGVPLHFQLFPKLWLDIYSSKNINSDTLNTSLTYLLESRCFLEYVDSVLLDERVSLNNQFVYQFLNIFFPKVSDQVLNLQVRTRILRLCKNLIDIANDYSLGSLHALKTLNGDLLALLLVLSSVPGIDYLSLRSALLVLKDKVAGHLDQIVANLASFPDPDGLRGSESDSSEIMGGHHPTAAESSNKNPVADVSSPGGGPSGSGGPERSPEPGPSSAPAWHSGGNKPQQSSSASAAAASPSSSKGSGPTGKKVKSPGMKLRETAVSTLKSLDLVLLEIDKLVAVEVAASVSPQHRPASPEEARMDEDAVEEANTEGANRDDEQQTPEQTTTSSSADQGDPVGGSSEMASGAPRPT